MIVSERPNDGNVYITGAKLKRTEFGSSKGADHDVGLSIGAIFASMRKADDA